MLHIKGEQRNQLCMFSLESSIAPDSFVRLIDAFVDSTDLKSFGFKNVDYIEETNRRVNSNPDYYRQRQQITEHIYGTLKLQRGFTHTWVKGKENVMGEISLMFIRYNLGRCANIKGTPELIKVLRDSILLNFKVKKEAFLEEIDISIFPNKKIAA